uniref:Uncharacterized protein n=1 Tax=Panagrolaimus sp. ES5 TaxID=591445 RepID=A0AC34G0Z5_9BILA
MDQMKFSAEHLAELEKFYKGFCDIVNVFDTTIMARSGRVSKPNVTRFVSDLQVHTKKLFHFLSEFKNSEANPPSSTSNSEIAATDAEEGEIRDKSPQPKISNESTQKSKQGNGSNIPEIIDQNEANGTVKFFNVKEKTLLPGEQVKFTLATLKKDGKKVARDVTGPSGDDVKGMYVKIVLSDSNSPNKISKNGSNITKLSATNKIPASYVSSKKSYKPQKIQHQNYSNQANNYQNNSLDVQQIIAQAVSTVMKNLTENNYIFRQQPSQQSHTIRQSQFFPSV